MGYLQVFKLRFEPILMPTELFNLTNRLITGIIQKLLPPDF
ncbi:MAG: hypothetical protein AAGG45_06075 [Pseudomonadota bacterium]